MAGLWRFLPCGSCCGGPTVECLDGCDGNLASEQYQLVFAGITTVICAGCASEANGTFILDNYTTCGWHYLFPSYLTGCAGPWPKPNIGLTFTKIGANNIVTVSFATGIGPIGYWVKTYVDPAKIPCTTFSSTDIPYSSGGGTYCDFSGATCKLTSI